MFFTKIILLGLALLVCMFPPTRLADGSSGNGQKSGPRQFLYASNYGTIDFEKSFSPRSQYVGTFSNEISIDIGKLICELSLIVVVWISLTEFQKHRMAKKETKP